MARMKSMGLEYPTSSVSMEFRSLKTKKIVVTAPVKEREVEYLVGLATTLITHDANAPEVATFVSKNFLRELPRICQNRTFQTSIKAKGDFERHFGELVGIVDDDDLSSLRSKYGGKMCYDK